LELTFQFFKGWYIGSNALAQTKKDNFEWESDNWSSIQKSL